MKIERISENQIKCTLNRSDLASRQIRMSELAYGTEKTKGLFQDMMEQASNEVGFDANDLPLMIEAIPVSMDCIVLMITKVEDPDEVDTKFSSLTRLNDLFSDASEDAPKAPFHRPGGKPQKPVQDVLSSLANAPATLDRLFSFEDLDTVISFAHHIDGIYRGFNSLYKCRENNKFYLLLTKSEHNIKEFGLVCNSALEYGSKESLNFARIAYLDEHFDKILDGNAVQSLANV
ncbi:MAG: adaptor protein MecA [Lachnospiraceae bacterium]|nr:adaptor protein MecA [Lachnospiraceae bacterium]